MKIYETRYQARKDKTSDEKVIKVCGGYVLMTAQEWGVWKKQK
jgi:hypothetical protein